VGNKHTIAILMEYFALLAAAQQQPERAARLFGAAESLRERIGVPLHPDDQKEHDQKEAAAREALGEPAFSTTWEAGRAMTWEEAVAYALEEDRT
jgi:non-specific serine/threonine protein kinase